MTISNTSILIKRSSATTNPGTLKSGELAYSYVSNTLYFGTVGGNGTMNIGGQYYTSQVDAATNANTAGTIVKRDANGAFAANLLGSSSNTYALINAQNFSISGGDISASSVSFNGTSAVTLNASLNSVAGLSAGYYGGTTAIPVVQVAANGRIMAIANTAVSTVLTFNDNKGDTGSVNLLNGQLDFTGTGGVTTLASGNTLTISTDNTVVRSNTSSVGVQTIGTDLNISGNLTVTGTTTTVNTQIINAQSSLIHLANNNVVGDVLDIGFVGFYNNGTANLSTGLVRDAGNKNYYLFSGLAAGTVTGNTIANNLFTTSNTATLYANINANTISVSTLSVSGTANVGADLGVAGNLYLTGNQVVTGTTTLTGKANTTNDLGVGGNFYVTGNATHTGKTTMVGQANTTNDLGVGGNLYASNNVTVTSGVYAKGIFNNTYTDGIVVDYSSALSQGRISVGSGDGIGFYTGGPATTALMNISSSGVISTATWQGQTVQVPYGGTGQSSFTSGSILVGNGSGALSLLSNTTFVATGSGAQNNTITSVTVDAYGRTTALTYSQILGLTVGQGGTGVSSFTTNGMVYGNGSGPLQVTAAAGSADQTWSNQIMTVTNAGVPVWSTALDGGTF